MQFTVQPQKPNVNQGNDMGDMLADILRSKPSFGGDVFGGPVFQSKWKWFVDVFVMPSKTTLNLILWGSKVSSLPLIHLLTHLINVKMNFIEN